MMQELKKFQINIFGESYYILSDQPEEKVNQAIELVDSLMKEAASRSPSADVKKIAILAALKLAERSLNFEAFYSNKVREKEELLINKIENELIG